MKANGAVGELDRLRGLKEAAELSGVHYRAIQRAAKCGTIPCYALGSSKRLVTLRDIFAVAGVPQRVLDNSAQDRSVLK